MTASIRQHNGTPTPFLDGVPVFAGYMWTRTPRPDGWEHAPLARLYADAGIHLYAFDVGAGGPRPEWCGPGPGRTGRAGQKEGWDGRSRAGTDGTDTAGMARMPRASEMSLFSLFT